jgi:uncharacterized protein with PIN domain
MSLALLLYAAVLLLAGAAAAAEENPNEACFACHADKTLTTKRGGRTVSLFVEAKKFSSSIHGSLACTNCHADLEGKDLPHEAPLKRVNCGACHDEEAKQLSKSLHGRAAARGDALAPRCVNCHGNHDILPAKDPQSRIAPLNIPLVCGQCHREGTPVQRNRNIGQHNILENYSESIHGQALLKKGLVVAPSCISCHTAHSILPHTDSNSSIARVNISKTCTKCHAEIEQVHRRVISGELWEKKAHVLPVCIDCHQPHKIRQLLYPQGMADADCMRCHADQHLKASDGRAMFVNASELADSRHVKVACSQCHSEVNASRIRPCETITHRVDCTACHAEIGQQYQRSMHGQLAAKHDANAPDCKECHGTHRVFGRRDPKSASFPINVPELCGRCHHEGHKAAVRYVGVEHQIVSRYEESIHGKGLLKSGLTVTATCTNCHTAHRELPASDPESTVNPRNVPSTCGQCHHGIQEQFVQSVHSATVTKTDKPLPVCSDCHTAHAIQRADQDQFKLEIMNKCGRCHAEIAKTYFDTYHGKVSKLGYTKTAKCYDCHGAHDILKVTDPRSHLSRANVVNTCRKCHADATRRFAGYLTHATHHDPKKYPYLFWTFWGMTSLLLGTFIAGGLHTLLWLPRAFQMRRELRAEEAREAAEQKRREEKRDGDR